MVSPLRPDAGPQTCGSMIVSVDHPAFTSLYKRAEPMRLAS
ncbi:hypothetical protein ACFOKI_12625 [Sphingomonas qilianensis]|uniref:Uncharacterized protein n=1 Tax=Sphingomonas qilianensis TaxID=1736690 RepID=A0ABU9XSQ6_9SPHN